MDAIVDDAEMQRAVVDALAAMPANGHQQVTIAIGVDNNLVADIGVGGGIDRKFGEDLANDLSFLR